MWAFLKVIAGLGLALFLAALSTSPQTAKSNLSGWVETIGGVAPAWLIPKAADNWGWVLFAVLTAVYLVIFWRKYAVAKARGLFRRMSLRVATAPIASVRPVVQRADQPFCDAARLAFEAVQRSELAGVVMGLNKTSAERISYFQYDILAHDLKMYGKPPPSSVAQEIPADELSRLHPVQGENALTDLFEPEPRYVDVTVDGGQLATYLADLKTRFPV